jgi:hypothetical protein
VAFLDSDDLWLPNKLAEQVAILDQHPDVVFVHCQASYIDAQGNPTRFRGKWAKGFDGPGPIIADQTKELFLFGTIITTSTVMVRRSTLDEVGIFDDTHIHGEDWELWVRLGSKGKLAYIPKPMAEYRVYGWQKVLKVEASDEWVSDQFRTIERATELWTGDDNELDRLRAQSRATIFNRGALANFQLGQGAQGQVFLAKAIEADPALTDQARLIQLAVDRAKLIELDTGSYEEANRFIGTFFANLPTPVAQFKNAHKEATAWLYLGNAFEKHSEEDQAAVRRLLARGVFQAPAVLKNPGVLSVALDAWLGKSLARSLRQGGRKISGLIQRSADAQS